ncbi:MAG: hypothetical protein KDK30_03445, partial [Leptospiraceae bacterium]|nr:hypothetical protein [Leptospiraceae bacterium]
CGIDLIYGFSEQQLDQFHADLNRALSVGISHLSIYSLTLEEGTPYYRNVSSGSKRAPNELLQTQIMDSLPSILSSAGFIQYEISNFARPGYMCRHNLRYWLHEPCLSLGPGAHGFDGINRYANTRNIQNWQESPHSAPMTPTEYPDDVLIGYLRLCTELSATELSAILLEGANSSKDRLFELIESCFRLWIARGYMDKKYQWTTDGVRFLDDRILEMTTILEKSEFL